MSDVTLQKQIRYWCRRTSQSEKDTVGEGITTGLILLLGCFSVINSIALVVHSVILVINNQQILIELLKTLILAGLLLAIGLGSLYFFRKRIHMLKKEKSPWRLQGTHAYLNLPISFLFFKI